MKTKLIQLIAVYLLLYAIIGLVIIWLSLSQVSISLNLACYTVVFVLLPIGASYGWFKRQQWTIWLTFGFALSQSVRVVGSSNWLPLNPPISLAFPVGSFEQGYGYLVDLAMLVISVLMLCLLTKKTKLN